MNYERIYLPLTENHPMRVFGMFSGGASSLRAMLDDPNRGDLYELVGTLTNDPKAFGIEYMETVHIPVEKVSFKKFCRENGLDPSDSPDPNSSISRGGYSEKVIKTIESYQPHIIALSGFMLLMPNSFLQEFNNRVLNVHPADTAILTGPNVERLYVGNLSPTEVAILMGDNQLRRKFVGGNAVYDAVMKGEEYTLSTIFLVRPGKDTGPNIVQSRRFSVDIPQGVPPEEYSKYLQEEMKLEGDGPAYLEALKLLATGRLGIGKDGITVFLDGGPLPYKGVQLSG